MCGCGREAKYELYEHNDLRRFGRDAKPNQD